MKSVNGTPAALNKKTISEARIARIKLQISIMIRVKMALRTVTIMVLKSKLHTSSASIAQKGSVHSHGSSLNSYRSNVIASSSSSTSEQMKEIGC